MLGPVGGAQVGIWQSLRRQTCNMYQSDVELLQGGDGRYAFDCVQRLNLLRMCNQEDNKEISETVLDHICHLWRVWE